MLSTKVKDSFLAGAVMILRRFLLVGRCSWARGVSASSGVARSRLSTAVGRIPSKPINYHSFGIIKVISVSAPFIYIGAYLAASFASYLEDFDLFVPDDDDD